MSSSNAADAGEPLIADSPMDARQTGLLRDLMEDILSAKDFGEMFSLAAGFYEQIGAGAVNCAIFDNSDFSLVGFSSSMRAAPIQNYEDDRLAPEDPLERRMPDNLRPAVLGWGYGITEPWRRGRSPLILKHLEDNGYYGVLFQPVLRRESPYSAAVSIVTELEPEAAKIYLHENSSLMLLAASILGLRAVHLFQPGDTDKTWRSRRHSELSGREREVVKALSLGHRPEQIAHELDIKPVTVHMHVASARQKLGARTREQLVGIALKKGLV